MNISFQKKTNHKIFIYNSLDTRIYLLIFQAIKL